MKTINQMLAEETMIFQNIRIEDITADEALKRLDRLKTKLFIMRDIEDKKSYMKNFARYALIGEIDSDYLDGRENMKNLQIDNVDVQQLDEDEIKERIEWLEKRVNSIYEPKDFITVARYALTGVPF